MCCSQIRKISHVANNWLRWQCSFLSARHYGPDCDIQWKTEINNNIFTGIGHLAAPIAESHRGEAHQWCHTCGAWNSKVLKLYGHKISEQKHRITDSCSKVTGNWFDVKTFEKRWQWLIFPSITGSEGCSSVCIKHSSFLSSKLQLLPHKTE